MPPRQFGSFNRETRIGWESGSEFLELFELWPNVDCTLLIQQDREQSLCSAGILNVLRREEEIFCCLAIEGSVFGRIAWLFSARVLEKKDDPINRT